MSTKHTPGPWHVEVYNEGRNMDIQDAQGRGVLTKENARLIAAAPDLLAALEDMVEALALDRLEDGGQFICEAYGEHFTAARAAIAKARGEA
jgi:hypothetical protein